MIIRKPWHVVSAWASAWALLVVLSVIFTSVTAVAQPAETWRTGQTVSHFPFDDGDVQAGVPWPEPRFVDNGDGTVTDHLTGLIWLKNSNCFGARTWVQALSDCNSLASGACGLNDGSLPGDWRLPNRKELFSLIDFSQDSPALQHGHPFTNVSPSPGYWSASTRAYYNYTGYVWIVSMYYGSVVLSNKDYNRLYVWPVRGGQGGSFGDLTDLDISQIPSPQNQNVPFDVTITAVDNHGLRITVIDGTVRLASNAHDTTVSPTYVDLVNGQWQGPVKINASGHEILLYASINGIEGESNPFDVISSGDDGGGGDGPIVTKDCSKIAGNWQGDWLETACDNASYSGTWNATVSNGCSFTGTTNWNHVSGTIDPNTLVLTATGTDFGDCGTISVIGSFANDSVSGSYTYSLGGGGTYSGNLDGGSSTDTSIVDSGGGSGGGGGCFIEAVFSIW